jgi:hypothetical protein
MWWLSLRSPPTTNPNRQRPAAKLNRYHSYRLADRGSTILHFLAVHSERVEEWMADSDTASRARIKTKAETLSKLACCRGLTPASLR